MLIVSEPATTRQQGDEIPAAVARERGGPAVVALVEANPGDPAALEAAAS
jgi:hypothetical protein